MSSHRQWLEQGLAALAPAVAARVRLFRLAVATGAALRNRLDREMATTGITTQQAALLQFIESCGDAPTMGTVAQGLSMTHQNVKQIAAVLQHKGFLLIEADEQDRRARRLRLTAKHRRFWAKRNPGDFARVQDWTAGLSDEEVEQACALLKKLLRSSLPVEAEAPREG